ncbi:hypothetical protein, variant [Aphanomyces astaci]|uniref:Uncharacterized protein n=1 Tax=Aphanomyces astaci TaxID=112090 RepID=W4GPC0_APHAT|nr:hypothetical protein, variant [Aphanomyces astaci]ETV81565.1 hypothetical protein, variant [Aphanomyces astaci]|eukprot:XP_009829423.1 hypothetical protein, variant [Aphanomyces astaci]
MEQYGRPRRKPSQQSNAPPQVAFLYPASSKASQPNQPQGLFPTKPKHNITSRTNHTAVSSDVKRACSPNVATTTTPSPPGLFVTPRDTFPKNMVAVVHKVRPSTASAVKSTSLTFHSAPLKPNITAEFPPDNDIAPPLRGDDVAVPTLKLRPSTASATKRTSLTNNNPRNHDTSSPQSPTSTPRTERPENTELDLTSRVSDDGGVGYIRRLKQDIQTIHFLLACTDSASPPSSFLSTTPNHLLTRRDSVPLPAHVRAAFALATQLQANDQLDHVKATLEHLLSDSLTQLISKTLVGSHGATTGNSIDDISGGGNDAGTVYLHHFLSLSRRAEMIQKKCITEAAEKECVQTQLMEVRRQLADAHNDIVLFKDTLDKVRGPGHGWSFLRSEMHRLGGSIAHVEDANPIDTSASPDDKTEPTKCAGILEQMQALEEKYTTLETQHAELQTAHTKLTKEHVTAKDVELNLSNELQGSQTTCAALRLSFEKSDAHCNELVTTVQSLQAQLDLGRSRILSLESDLETTNTQLKKASADAKTQIHQAQVSYMSKLDVVGEAARQLQLRLQHEWEARLAEVEQTQQMQLHVMETSHGRALAAQADAFSADKQAWDTERLAATHEHSATLDQLSRANEALEAEKTRSRTLATDWSVRLEEKSKALETVERQVHALDAANLQLKLAVSETKIAWRHDMETTWLQQIATLEHALAQARAKLDAEREKFHLELQAERDRVHHVVTQAKSVADELETANLCLAERKRQREADQDAFEAREKRAAAAIARLTEELQELQQHKAPASKRNWDAECRQLHQHNDELAAQVRGLKEQVDVLSKKKEEDLMSLKVQHDKMLQLELAVRVLEASNVDAGHQLAVARASVAELERQLDAAKDECQLMDMAATESRLQQQARLNDRLGMEKRVVQEQLLDLDMATQNLMEEKQLLQQVVTRLNDRLKLQLELLTNVPSNESRNSMTKHEWAEAQAQWQRLQGQCDDADWQLLHMKERLDEMESLMKGGPSSSKHAAAAKKRPAMAHRKQSPFSDAIAAGQRTVAVADKLHQHQSPEIESDSYAAALAKEMKAMKDTYEAKLQDLHAELKRVQNMRCEHTARLQRDLADDKAKYTSMRGTQSFVDEPARGKV